MNIEKLKHILKEHEIQFIDGIIVDRKGNIITSSSELNPEFNSMVSDLCLVLCRGTREMSKTLNHPNETQGISIGDEVNLLFTWLKGDLFFVTLQSKLIDPKGLPDSYHIISDQLRLALPELEETYDKKWWQFWKS